MSNLRNTDLLIIGRGQQSYNVSFADIKESVNNGIVLPDPSNSANQPGTLDDRYVNITGDTLTGSLILSADPTLALEAATKQYVDSAVASIDILPDMADTSQQAGTLDDRYVNVFGDTMVGELLLQSTTDSANAQAVVRKAYVDAGDAQNAADISKVAQDLSIETSRSQLAEAGLSTRINQEVSRAQGAESDLDDKIDALVLNDLADVSVAGVTDRQVVSYDAGSGEFVARTIALSSNLDYQGQIDLTASAVSGEAGELRVNVGVGSTDSSYGAAVTGPIPNVVGGELVAHNGSAWQYVGTVGGGLTFTSFSANNVAASANSGGELSYNSDTGIFTYEAADIESRIPTDISKLSALPA